MSQLIIFNVINSKYSLRKNISLSSEKEVHALRQKDWTESLTIQDDSKVGSSSDGDGIVLWPDIRFIFLK